MKKRNLGLTFDFVELDAAMERGGWTKEELQLLCSADNLALVLMYLRGKAQIITGVKAASGQIQTPPTTPDNT